MTHTRWAEISRKGGAFTDRDLYRVVYGLDGKAFVEERIELGRARPTFRQDHTFTNAVSRKVEPEQMYCKRLDDTVVCGGVHKN
ncbi:MAG: hypothetical protein NTW15_11745 [Burkholderiales bacterium]|nr:hypothetical protein [Burkholderiales bacterium]